MEKNKFYYLIVLFSMFIYSSSAIYYEAYSWLLGSIWYAYYLKKWYPIWE